MLINWFHAQFNSQIHCNSFTFTGCNIEHEFSLVYSYKFLPSLQNFSVITKCVANFFPCPLLFLYNLVDSEGWKWVTRSYLSCFKPHSYQMRKPQSPLVSLKRLLKIVKNSYISIFRVKICQAVSICCREVRNAFSFCLITEESFKSSFFFFFFF